MTGTIITIIVILVLVAALVSYVISLYNGLVQANNNTEKAFNNIDVLLQQRYEELPKLVDAAKGYMKHEHDLLGKIVRLRMAYQGASGRTEKVHTENQLADLLGRFNVVVEKYPDLKAIDSFNQLQVRVSALESQIADRRELYNDSINIYNIRIERLPDVILSRMLGYAKQPYLNVPGEKTKDILLDLPT